MDTKPDISNLRLNQTPCTGQSAGNSINTAMASGNVVDFNQEAALYEYIDYPLMSPVDQLAVCAALPTDSSIDTIYLSADQESSIAASVTALNIDKKHMCAICEDRASGKHYGVYSCEGCKGFFKRTVRKDLHYACRDEKSCVIDRRQRNRCQYCRYQKCIAMGMKREAVQEERMGSVRDRADDSLPEIRAQPTVSRSAFIDMPVDKVYEAEMASEPHFDAYVDATEDPIGTFCHAAEKQLYTLVDWAKRIPYFTDLPIDDQVTLLRSGWNELLIAGFSHRSINVDDAVLLATGLRITRDCANEAGIGAVFDRVMVELVAKMREMKMDKTELGCLRAIVLYNPDAKGLTSVDMVERLREKVYASLDEYCRRKHPNEPGRFAKLLLRLPALRSIGLKSIEHLFFYKLMADSNVDSFLIEMLDIPTASSPADTTAPAESSTFALCSSNS